MFGRQTHHFLDLALGLGLGLTQVNGSVYQSTLRNIEKSYEPVVALTKTSRARQKKGYSIRVRGATLQTGDRVLVKILAFNDKH